MALVLYLRGNSIARAGPGVTRSVATDMSFMAGRTWNAQNATGHTHTRGIRVERRECGPRHALEAEC